MVIGFLCGISLWSQNGAIAAGRRSYINSIAAKPQCRKGIPVISKPHTTRLEIREDAAPT
jgi:hypothetical protein